MANATKTASSQQKKKDNIIYILIGINLLFNLVMLSLIIDLRSEMQNLNYGIVHLDQMIHSTFPIEPDAGPIPDQNEPLFEMDVTPVAP
ncbi:hypothetical protein AN640_00570 [Candidatus Epulonipiscium fishelsonii]|uniref:Uncharacterized protein n=1 Tax=Candidatus Epulonipiscium fishelsonii TaxID=77094 RepID=A0ACC8X8A0_9FIRM|nr:hypothetical protein AN640_00570 [Epulopiscium sp. SCG-D08WGA-EpuloA1]OON92426.1 MAG: hypothetical protein ATN32_09715 [Epulopiscium sp. AS2M-Bin002]